jgi:hypothetical protein
MKTAKLGMKLGMKNVTTVLAIASLTAAATLTAFWPKQTLADDDADALEEWSPDGTRLGHILVSGEIVKDPKSKTGWVVEISAENQGTESETARLETDLTRVMANPMARAQPRPTTVWKQVESVTLAAGEKITKRYTVPAAFGAQLTATANADARMNKAMEAGKPMPASAMLPRPYFNVLLKKVNA